MKKLTVILGLMLVMCLLVPVSCAKAPPTPAPAPPTQTPLTPAPVPMPSPVLTNSESASRIAELEAKIRQLEAENQRLLTENRQLEAENQRLVTENQGLSDNLAKVTTQLQVVQSLVTSSRYTYALSTLTEIQNDTNELAVFLEGLPSLPTLPPGLDDISKVNDIITKAIFLRNILKNLPPPPPLIAPAQWYELDEMKDEFIRMTEWMEDLEELPEFLNIAGDLDDVRYQEIDHLHNINASTYDIIDILEQVRDAIQP